MPEIIVIFFAALIFMGPEKMPKLAKDIGKFLRNINSTVSDLKKEIEIESEVKKDKEEIKTEFVKDFPEEKDPYLNKEETENENEEIIEDKEEK